MSTFKWPSFIGHLNVRLAVQLFYIDSIGTKVIEKHSRNLNRQPFCDIVSFGLLLGGSSLRVFMISLSSHPFTLCCFGNFKFYCCAANIVLIVCLLGSRGRPLHLKREQEDDVACFHSFLAFPKKASLLWWYWSVLVSDIFQKFPEVENKELKGFTAAAWQHQAEGWVTHRAPHADRQRGIR